MRCADTAVAVAAVAAIAVDVTQGVVLFLQWALRVLDNEELGARREAASAGTSDRVLDLRLSAAHP